ncbi:hypothetical protein B0H63DRAFT_515399 [Podospora didyma]|uniref:LysM domain-containing protein n=1 Tax=Podospora didyma TaxID=330526 RepID=A0AAE0K1C0_9PEZI|nr:hypothetical protein B0H63DRAFT_515399 [Podospora didyma]
MLWLFLCLGLFGLSPSLAQQVNFLNITAPYQNFSNGCISVLNQAVACDPIILNAGLDGKFESDQTLATVCTEACNSSLTYWVRRVAGACGDTRYTSGQASLLASFMAQEVLENWSTLSFTLPSSVVCNPCAISVLSTSVQMPIGNAQTEAVSQYAALTASCKISGKAITPLATTTTWITMAPTATSACAGTVYTLKAGDNCRSVSLAQGISTTHLLSANNLQAYCANFPTAGTLCIPKARKCKPYQLKADLTDSCRTVAAAQNATYAQIVSWNPEVGEFCESIKNLAKGGQVLCVSTPGGGWVNPYPETTSASSFTPETYFTLPATEFALAPKPTLGTALPYPNIGYVDPIANDTILDCALHRPAPVKVNQTSFQDSYLCSDYAKFYGITVDKLVEWNPSLASRVVNKDCTLWAGEQYCAQRDLDQSANMSEYCLAPGQVAEPGLRSTCDGFVKWYGLNKTDFLEWNPGLGSKCERFHSGNTYCTRVRGFRPAGTISTCSRWHMATDIKPANNPCGTIETKYGLQHARFVAWNPSLLNDCSGIRLWYSYCVGTPQFPGTG